MQINFRILRFKTNAGSRSLDKFGAYLGGEHGG